MTQPDVNGGGPVNSGPGHAVNGGPAGTRAVVLGASVAGLLAARVLADHVDEVIIVEGDDVTGSAHGRHRGGAAQGRHLHALMERGRQILEELFPGLTAELAAGGVPAAETLVGTRWYFDGARVAPASTGLTSVLASRPVLEAALRARTLARPGARLLPGVRAVGLAPAGTTRVAGVRIRPLAGDAPARVLAADLVVDATGRGTRGPEWLEELGLARPRADSVDVDLAYASRTYRRRPGELGGDFGVIISTLPGRRGGGAVAQEGDRWIVTLAGMLGDHPPVDPDGYDRFAASLPAGDIHRLIQGAQPLDDPVRYRFRTSRWLRYDRLRPGADGFLAIGDALCAFNPLYAQGMTVAAQQALALRDCLQSAATGVSGAAGLAGAARLDGLARRYFAAAAGPTSRAWSIATDSDLRYREIPGRRGLRTRVINAYVPRVQAATRADPVLARALLRVVNLVEPSSTLLAPAVLARTVRFGLRRIRTLPPNNENG
ncbi:FAD-dependent oxidoreductase [Frankia sp. Cpl3]|uniref:NAD(P)/FAD-dependent oxidoreductase n=1 Tax=Parafrankia colletiae TaxID=573497 RepID=UPI000A78B05A|nr:FAD-dependent oxidoreductase [Parafrankia colletiae]MCK9904039.1 FAD-dependent oxidoreductase [Frankia sp. Cpl3]